MSVNCTKDDLVCPNVWYTFRKIIKIKFDDVRGQLYIYGLRYNLISFICSQRPIQPYIKVSEIFNVFLNLNDRLNSILGRNSQNGLLEINFFSVEKNFKGNLHSTNVVKVFLVRISNTV